MDDISHPFNWVKIKHEDGFALGVTYFQYPMINQYELVSAR